jgi:hypothetical protein
VGTLDLMKFDGAAWTKLNEPNVEPAADHAKCQRDEATEMVDLSAKMMERVAALDALAVTAGTLAEGGTNGPTASLCGLLSENEPECSSEYFEYSPGIGVPAVSHRCRCVKKGFGCNPNDSADGEEVQGGHAATDLIYRVISEVAAGQSLPSGHVARVEVRAEGNRLRCTIDDYEAVNVVDPDPIPAGAVGFATYKARVEALGVSFTDVFGNPLYSAYEGSLQATGEAAVYVDGRQVLSNNLVEERQRSLAGMYYEPRTIPLTFWANMKTLAVEVTRPSFVQDAWEHWADNRLCHDPDVQKLADISSRESFGVAAHPFDFGRGGAYAGGQATEADCQRVCRMYQYAVYFAEDGECQCHIECNLERALVSVDVDTRESHVTRQATAPAAFAASLAWNEAGASPDRDGAVPPRVVKGDEEESVYLDPSRCASIDGNVGFAEDQCYAYAQSKSAQYEKVVTPDMPPGCSENEAGDSVAFNDVEAGQGADCGSFGQKCLCYPVPVAVSTNEQKGGSWLCAQSAEPMNDDPDYIEGRLPDKRTKWYMDGYDRTAGGVFGDWVSPPNFEPVGAVFNAELPVDRSILTIDPMSTWLDLPAPDPAFKCTGEGNEAVATKEECEGSEDGSVPGVGHWVSEARNTKLYCIFTPEQVA